MHKTCIQPQTTVHLNYVHYHNFLNSNKCKRSLSNVLCASKKIKMHENQPQHSNHLIKSE